MRIRLRKIGNPCGVILPKRILARIGVQTGVRLDISLDGSRIVLVPAKLHPRTGWADAARRIASSGDDTLVWPEFGNAEDADNIW